VSSLVRVSAIAFALVACSVPGSDVSHPAAVSDLAFVDVAVVAPSVVLDLRYATEDNFAGEAVYPVAQCLLLRPVAETLARVAGRVEAEGYRLAVWDCYRPFAVQQRFWELVPDERYVARPVERDGAPVEGSKHNRGAAVDATLVGLDGRPVEMPTGYDDFSERAGRDLPGASEAARRHATLLAEAMAAEGFEQLPTEWWHFDHRGWQRYPLADVPLTAP